MAFWAAFGLLLPQALWVRRTTPRFQGAAGDPCGLAVYDALDESKPPLQLLGLGDSIIAGVGASHHTEALVAQAALGLSGALNRPVAWQVHGKIGADARRIAHEARKIDWPSGVDVVVISTGVNDLLGLSTIAQWQDKIVQLIKTVRSYAPDAWLVFCGLPPMQVFPRLPRPLKFVLGYRAHHLDEILGWVAGSFDRVRWVPIQSPIESAADLSGELPNQPPLTPEMFAGDGFHPGPLGYQALGQGLAKAVAAAIKSA
ncbi:MAG TPA: SGNH/GDSL hydrolase family protein [Wenzhouxiangella sp.]